MNPLGSAALRELPAASRDERGCVVTINGVALIADSAGALFWPEERLLVVSDLHLEKGSSLASRGVLLPPYDTAATLAQLAAVIARHAPRVVVTLGDSFHDRDAHHRLTPADRASIAALQAGRDWIWIAGNHDPAPPEGVAGSVAEILSIGRLTFRHEPTGASGEIAGHLHPLAHVATRARWVRRRCFATDGVRMVMPAFGAYAGGLNIRDGAFARVFTSQRFTAHLLGDGRLHAIPAARCLR